MSSLFFFLLRFCLDVTDVTSIRAFKRILTLRGSSYTLLHLKCVIDVLQLKI